LDHAERVLVVPTERFHQIGYFQGFSTNTSAYLEHLLDAKHTGYRPRAEVEEDPSYKQLIPYVIFRYTDASGRESLFQYTRGSGQGEQRLHQKRSIGIGGHISSIDAEEVDPYAEGMRRELEEEVIIGASYRERCVGLINDDQTEVGKVHLGVVHLFEMESPRVKPREREIIAAGFEPVEDLFADLTEFESWSSICLQALFGS
jgi:predicted NUDIX family phosphoesterase